MACAPTTYQTGIGYTASLEAYACAPGGAYYITPPMGYNLAAAELYCINLCNSYRNNMYTPLGCESFLLTQTGSSPTTWRCDFYSGDLPAAGIHNQCPGAAQTYSTIVGMYHETINSCLAVSAAQASAFCSSYIPLTATIDVTSSSEETAYTAAPPAIVTSYLSSYITQTFFVTVPVTTTSFADAPNPGVSTVTATATVTQSYCVSPSPLANNGNRVDADAGRPRLPRQLLFQRSQDGDADGFIVLSGAAAAAARVTAAPGAQLRHKQNRRAVPAPACLKTASTLTPAALFSSGCSCLNLATSTLTRATTAFFTSFITTTVTQTLSVTATAPVVNVPITSTVPTTIGSTTTGSITSTTTTTATVTVSVQRTSTVEIFSMVARPAQTGRAAAGRGGAAAAAAQDDRPVYNLLTRIFGTRGVPGDRVVQYRKQAIDGGPHPAPGVNGTIIDGKLFVLSLYNNPRLYGFGKTLPAGSGPDSGRVVLGEQHSLYYNTTETDTLLTGCSVDQATSAIKCNLGSGSEIVQVEEIGWPTNPKRRFMLALVPPGTRTATASAKRLMELIATDYDTITIGCNGQLGDLILPPTP